MTNEMQNTNPKPRSDVVGEVLVRGADGKMYILRDGRLVPRGVLTGGDGNRLVPVAARPPVPVQPANASPAPTVKISIEDELAAAGGFRLSDALIVQRMKDIADIYARGVRDELETRAALLRSLKLGGMGLKSEAAENVLTILRRLPKEELKVKPASVRLSPLENPPQSPFAKGGGKYGRVREVNGEAQKPPAVAGELDQLVVRAVKKVGLQLGDPALVGRFKTIVSARLRDVRDTLETRDILVREVKVGGLGLSPVEADRIGGMLNGFVQEFTNIWQARERELTEDWKKKQARRLAREIGSPRADEAEIDKRHDNLLTQGAKAPQPAVAKILPPPPPHSAMPLPAVIPKKIITTLAPPPPKQIVVPAEKTAVAPLAPSLGAYARPKVQDVRFSPRLLSPIDELKELKITDFRRLGRDEGEIVFKLRAKIDLLAEESFAKKMDGIKALKQSEPWRLYFLLSARALATGTPVEDIIEECEKKKEPTLKSEEFRAIMEMNKGLRF